jgi:hypothetical protein
MFVVIDSQLFGSQVIFTLFFRLHCLVREGALERTIPSMIFVCVLMFMMFMRNGVRNSIPNPRVNEGMERAKRPMSKKKGSYYYS